MTKNILNPIPLIIMAIYSELGVCSLTALKKKEKVDLWYAVPLE
jgi:hypothetical protein